MLFCLLIILALIVALGDDADRAMTQSVQQVRWASPVRLSNPEAVIQHSTIAVDPWGGIHVLWVHQPGSDQLTNLLFYTRFEEGMWTEPVDIFVGANWDAFNFPYVLCDPEGKLHLVWVGGEGVYYSSVTALEATDTKQWQSPQLIARAPSVGRVRFALDARDVLHLVYASQTPGANLQYMRLENDAAFWTDATPISELFPSDPQAVNHMQIAVDSNDRVHVVWAEVYPPSWIEGQILYTYSDDNGISWHTPTQLSEMTSDGRWGANATLVIDGEDTLHVVWVCGIAERCTRFSDDNGKTWAQTQRLFEGLIGLSGWDSMTSDPYGNVYWLGSLRYPQAQYFSTISEQRWTQPPLPLSDAPGWDTLTSGHFPHLVSGMGNTLHLVLVESSGGPLWYVQGRTDYPAMIATPAPTITPTISLHPETPLVQSTPNASIVEAALPSFGQQLVEPTPPIMPVILGVSGALAFVVVALFLNRTRSR